MIRLNDIDKTVIDESKVVAYYGYGEDKTCIYLGGTIYVDYNSKELRDKDIELLDQLFDVKSIEDKANAYPHEIDALKFAMSGIKKECEPVKEEYITWDYVKQYAMPLKVEMPNGDIKAIWYDNHFSGVIGILNPNDKDNYDACFYDEDLFNALLLKKVE
jgi:hypothetical protein